ncbi:MAG TPA: DUF4126 domain-containing protein [Accumulibacter sp.]|nr:DUF4126 domain-containing protein [Accumulibacter sp.]
MTTMDSSLPLDLTGLLALAAGLGWASGVRLYAALFIVGVVGKMGWFNLPDGLRVLEHPWVLSAAGAMLLVEFLADKVPLIDSLWDSLQGFIRIPAGAALAAMAFGGQGVEWQTAMAIVGGGLAASAHLAKAGTRATVNLSPEPFSNVATSLGEDTLVAFVLWLAFAHPWALFGFLAVFVILLLWLLPKLYRLVFGRRRARRQAGVSRDSPSSRLLP